MDSTIFYVLLLTGPGLTIIGMVAGAFIYHRGQCGISPLPKLPLGRQVKAEKVEEIATQKRVRI